MRVLIAGGGTAGHIFPGLALAEELRKDDSRCQIVMVVSSHTRNKKYLKACGLLLNEIAIEVVSAVALPYKCSAKIVLFAARLVWAFLQSFIIILKYRPEVAVGFGGYTSFAPLLTARIFGIPVLIHEQNVIPGRANKLLSRIAKRIAITFADTDRLFFSKSNHRKVVQTGLPLRKHTSSAQNPNSDKASKFTILVIGGSQGAHSINELVLNCLRIMDRKDLTSLKMIHLTGKRDLLDVKKNYESLDVNSRTFDFLNDMNSAYSNADLLIGRSGANTIFEAANFGLPCILIPYLRGSTHQKENALFFKRRGAALILEEGTASVKNLTHILLDLIANKKMRESLSQRIRMLASPDAAYNLKEEVKYLYSCCHV